MTYYAKTERTTVKRLPDRGVYDREQVLAILDEGFICHLGYVSSDGTPVVIPTTYGRDGDCLYVHGSAISRTLQTLAGGVQVCLTVTLIDGMVLARSAFHHSINYRSVMVFGTAVPVTDPALKLAALATITNHLLPGRWEEVRETREVEVNATIVLKLLIDEVSAKVRTGEPHDNDEDVDLPIWAGVLPVQLQCCTPIVAPDCMGSQPLPDSVARFRAVHAPRSGSV